MTGRLKRKKKDIDCKVEVGEIYNLKIDAITKRNMSKRDIDLRTKYIGKCIFKNDNIVVFDNGKYNVTEIINTYGIDWRFEKA